MSNATPADPAALFALLGLPAPKAEFIPAWNAIQASFPPSGKLAFLEADSIRSACRTLNMSAESEAALLASLSSYERLPALKRLAWYVYREVSAAPTGTPPRGDWWPELPRSLGSDTQLLYAHALLGALPSILEFHKQRGIAQEITLDTLSDLELWIKDDTRVRKTPCLFHPWWLGNHFAGRIFKIGRLQYEQHIHWSPFRMYRHRRERRVVALAESGQRFRADGQFDGANGISDPNACTSSLEITADTIRGTRVDPRRGAAVRDPVTLDAHAWEEVLKTGDPVLGLHIPASGPMDPASCADSFRRAGPFYSKHFPERPYKAIVTSTWLLDAQLEDYLPADSNIVQFLAAWYLLPYPRANDHQIWERVFDGPVDLDKAPQKTSVQRAVIAHVRKGGHWRTASGVIFPEDLDLAPAPYRKMTPP